MSKKGSIYRRMMAVAALMILHSFTPSFFHSFTLAQQVILDHEWYLAGDKMTVAVEVAKAEAASKVAYVELCDAEGLQASAMLALSDGRGQGVIELPSAMHSGYYQLSMYTRMGTRVLQRYVPVVNIMQKSSADDIEWVEAATTTPLFCDQSQKTDSITLTPPLDNTNQSAIPAAYLNLVTQRHENDGHCIYARIHRSAGDKECKLSQINSTLAIVGKEVHIFEGKMLDDSTAVFLTYDVKGRHSIVLSAETFDKKQLPIEIINPFAAITPKQLPHLQFNYNRSEVEQRSLAMQARLANDTLVVDSTVYKEEIFSTKPILTYNLDEYRQFRTIREALLEYVQYVHRTERYGVLQLFVYTEAVGYSDWPALVLIDGMPVSDLERLMKYDARRVHYISVYDDFYTFGNLLYKGIVNIVTRTGRLTNFPPEKTSAYLVYNFPQ